MAKDRMGRPRVADADKRSMRMAVYFTKAEASSVQQRASAAGLRPAVYCRSVVLRVRLSSRVTKTALHQLSRIGNNLNQLAYHANASGRVAEWHELMSVLRAIRAKMDEL